MLYFLSDYTEGCHPKVLERLAETNLVSQPGYGEDAYCRAAAEKGIRFTAACVRADTYIVAVPTPLDGENRMDGSCLLSAVTEILSACPEGAVLVIESTVAPGTCTGCRT